MPWELIENVRPATTKAALPANGIALRCRAINFTKGKRSAKWIELLIASDLAAQLMLRPGAEHRIALFFGSGSNAGKLAIAIDASNGGFVVKQKKDGRWSVSINEQSCDGLLALDFGTITLSAELLHERGEPPKAVVKLSSDVILSDYQG